MLFFLYLCLRKKKMTIKERSKGPVLQEIWEKAYFSVELKNILVPL